MALVAAGCLSSPTVPASAADASRFDPGNIISDETFFNSAAMSTDQVQSFLNSKVVNCSGANGQPCLKNYTQSTSTMAADSYCNAYSGQGSESAAQIIVRVGQACGINPQVLLVMLQKEQGLVLSTGPTAGAYRSAMGYACPDTAPCDTQYYGFFNQVYNAAHQFQRYSKTSSSWSYQPGRVNSILYNPNAACGRGNVFIQNQATANLYIYTPYQPNAAALANLYGVGDGCSSYGNRNFWAYFSDWFGSPSNWFQAASFEGGSTTGWTASNGFINRAVYNSPSLAQNGNWFFASNTPVAGRSFTQDVVRQTNIGEQAVAEIWLRSADSTPFTGSVVLWGLGGTQEKAQTDFTVTGSWQKVRVELPVRRSSHSVIRMDVYMGSTNATLWADNSSLGFEKAPIPKNMLVEPSFEGSFDGWAQANGPVNQQVYKDPSIAQDGSWFAATNTSVGGRSLSQDVVVQPNRDDRYTASLWVRALDAGKWTTGTLALWGLGGPVNYVARTDFRATGTWQEVKVTFSAGSAPISTLRVELYMADVGTTYLLDNSALSVNRLQAGSFENGLFTNWGTGNGSINQAVYAGNSSAAAKEGAYFAATNTQQPGSSLAQVVEIVPKVGETYTAEVWLRSSTSTPFSGRLAIWALGGSTESVQLPYTVGSTWTPVTVKLPIKAAGHTMLKFEIYEDTPNVTLFVDAAQLY